MQEKALIAAAPPSIRLLTTSRTALALVVLYAAIICFYAVPLLTLRTLIPHTPHTQVAVSVGFCVVVLTCGWRYQSRIVDVANRAISWMAKFDPPNWFAFCVLVGMAVRLGWILAFPAEPVSDGAVYVALARRLISGAPYEIANTRAYWPPGYPLFLCPWLALIPHQAISIALSNIALFLVGIVGVWKLSGALCGLSASAFAVMLFALWPNLIFQVGMPEKEQLLASLLPWIVFLTTARSVARPANWQWLVAGCILGFCTLTQPLLQLFPLVLLASGVLRGTPAPTLLTQFVALAIGMTTVIAPWTLRNYTVFDRFVIVSTNGGSAMYRANNPLATGGYTPAGEFNLELLPEVDADDVGRKLAREWIVANPAAFGRLAFEKNVRFMGDDAVGAYQTLHNGRAGQKSAAYIFFKGTANMYWMFLWLGILVALIDLARNREKIPASVLTLFLTFVYFFSIHSVAESAGKYHVVLAGILAVLLSTLIHLERKQEKSGTLTASILKRSIK